MFPIQNLYHQPPPPCAVPLLLRASAVLFALSCFGGTALQNRMPVLGRCPIGCPALRCGLFGYRRVASSAAPAGRVTPEPAPQIPPGSLGSRPASRDGGAFSLKARFFLGCSGSLCYLSSRSICRYRDIFLRLSPQNGGYRRRDPAAQKRVKDAPPPVF